VERADPAPAGRDWHALSTDEALAALESDARRGLSSDEAAARLETYGPNRLPEEPGQSPLIRFLKQFHNILIYVLIAAAGLTAFLGEWIDTGVIAAVVVINAIIGFVQEGKAERALEEIRRMLSLEAEVIRDGRRDRIDAELLVPGDIVLLESGDRAPADLRILKAREVRVEEAALTGESAPVAKHPDAVEADAVLGDRHSIVHSSTVLATGQLRGMVVATGTATEIGRIGEMVSGVTKVTTPLLQKIDRFGRQLSGAIIGFSVLLFLTGWLIRDYAPTEMFLVVVSFAVAAIPEGLPAVLTITLALGVQRMGRRNAIIRRLPAVETLGSVTTICSDKTGTLTRNELTVGRVLLPDRTLHVSGTGYTADGEIHDPASHVDKAHGVRGVDDAEEQTTAPCGGWWRPRCCATTRNSPLATAASSSRTATPSTPRCWCWRTRPAWIRTQCAVVMSASTRSRSSRQAGTWPLCMPAHRARRASM
jgi:magnesium-transporting ATPase (P-type)